MEFLLLLIIFVFTNIFAFTNPYAKNVGQSYMYGMNTIHTHIHI